eukprot:2698483-Amphidinium_carterae.7
MGLDHRGFGPCVMNARLEYGANPHDMYAPCNHEGPHSLQSCRGPPGIAHPNVSMSAGRPDVATFGQAACNPGTFGSTPVQHDHGQSVDVMHTLELLPNPYTTRSVIYEHGIPNSDRGDHGSCHVDQGGPRMGRVAGVQARGGDGRGDLTQPRGSDERTTSRRSDPRVVDNGIGVTDAADQGGIFHSADELGWEYPSRDVRHGFRGHHATNVHGNIDSGALHGCSGHRADLMFDGGRHDAMNSRSWPIGMQDHMYQHTLNVLVDLPRVPPATAHLPRHALDAGLYAGMGPGADARSAAAPAGQHQTRMHELGHGNGYMHTSNSFVGMPPHSYHMGYPPMYGVEQPRRRESDNVHLPELPTPARFRSWRLEVKRNLAAASVNPQAAFEWVTQAEHLPPHHMLLAHPESPYQTLDIKLSCALWKILGKSDLARRLYVVADRLATHGHMLSGRQVLVMIYMSTTTLRCMLMASIRFTTSWTYDAIAMLT